jgi:hypothetical protein
MDALEKLKDIISDDIYNEIEEAFEEKDSRISELESEKEDLEYEVSSNESQISTLECKKEEIESELFKLNHILDYYIDDYIEENFPTFQLILKSEYNELKEEHEKYREGWIKWEDNKYEYEYLKKSKEWDNISKLTITNPPPDMNKDNEEGGYPISYWVNYISDKYEETIISRYVYRSTRSVSEIDEDEPYQLVESEDPEFKIIGTLKIFYNPWTKKEIKRIRYFSTLKKNVLNKYFNLLKKNKSTKL